MGAVVIARGIPRVQDLQAVGLLPVQRWCRRRGDWARETVHWRCPMLPCWQLMRPVADSGVRDCQTTTARLYIDTSLVDLHARVTFWFALITFDVTLAAGRASVDMSGRSLETRTPCKESGAAELPHGVMFRVLSTYHPVFVRRPRPRGFRFLVRCWKGDWLTMLQLGYGS